jgi:hypothetical protein
MSAASAASLSARVPGYAHRADPAANLLLRFARDLLGLGPGASSSRARAAGGKTV